MEVNHFDTPIIRYCWLSQPNGHENMDMAVSWNSMEKSGDVISWMLSRCWPLSPLITFRQNDGKTNERSWNNRSFCEDHYEYFAFGDQSTVSTSSSDTTDPNYWPRPGQNHIFLRICMHVIIIIWTAYDACSYYSGALCNEWWRSNRTAASWITQNF